MSEQQIPSKISDIKAEIISLGFGDRMLGITEKSELIDLLKQARIAGNTSSASVPASASAEAPTVTAKASGLRKIPVLLIGEMHESRKCLNTIVRKLFSIVGPMEPNEYFAVSEGNGLNNCYKMLTTKFPEDRIIVEDDKLNKKIALNLFLLETQLFIAVATGELKRGRGSKAGPGVPDSVTIDENTFLEKGRSRFSPILQAMPNGFRIYGELVDAMFNKNMGLFYKLYDQILTFLINSDYLNELTNSVEIKRSLSRFIQSKDYNFLREITRKQGDTRDSDIIKRVEQRAIMENSSLKLIIIVFGARHYDNLEELIKKSSVLEFDSRQSEIVMEGGKKNTQKRSYKKRSYKKRSYKKRNYKKRNTKSKRVKK
jgi:hypothetical protein